MERIMIAFTLTIMIAIATIVAAGRTMRLHMTSITLGTIIHTGACATFIAHTQYGLLMTCGTGESMFATDDSTTCGCHRLELMIDVMTDTTGCNGWCRNWWR